MPVLEAMPALHEFGIDAAWLAGRGLAPCEEASALCIAQVDPDGREHRLAPDAAVAWEALRMAAQADGIILSLASAFRSVERQLEICQAKLAAGQPPEEIFAQSAPPGFSEHHSGRALDIQTPDCPPFAESFAATPAYRWLQDNARRFGFRLSFPEGNPQGFVFEPWHWYFEGLE